MLGKTGFVLLLVLFLCVSSKVNATSSNTLVNVWKALGWNRLILVSKNLGQREASLMKSASQQNIQISLINHDMYHEAISEEGENPSFSQSYYVFLGKSSFEELRHCLLQFRRPYSIMMINDQNESKEAETFLGTIDQAFGFLHVILSESNDQAQLFRIQTFIGGGSYVQDEWTLSDSGHYLTSYDMQGHHVTSSTLSWSPWFVVNEDCVPQDPRCRHSGILAEMMDLMGSAYNFTWGVTLEPEGNWGVSPLNREDGLQAHDYIGVLGDIVNRKFDICISVWTFIHERVPFIDHTDPVTTTPKILMIDGSRV